MARGQDGLVWLPEIEAGHPYRRFRGRIKIAALTSTWQKVGVN